MFIFAFSLFLCCGLANSIGSYKEGDKVEIFVNKVGPYFNPHETYHYYSLPVCRPVEIKHKSLTLGEVLDGDRMAYSDYKVFFKKDEKDKELCEVELNEKELDQLREAIEDLYYFEMVADDLPMRNFLGHFTEHGFLAMPHTHDISLYNHITFGFTYNGDKVSLVLCNTFCSEPLIVDTKFLSGNWAK